MNQLSNTHQGILLMLLASFLFALTMVFAKFLSSSMGSVEITFWRNAIGLIIIAFTLFHTPITNKGGKPFTLIFRGVIGTIALLAFFYTISITSLSNAIVYAKTEPIFTAILAFIILKENLPVRAIFAIVIGFIGVVLMSGLEWDYLHSMGILCGFFSALAYTSVRSLKDYYDPRTVVLSFMIAGVFIPFIAMIAAEYYTSELFRFALNPFILPKGIDWLWIALMGTAAAMGQIYMTRAYFYASAGLISTVSYSVVLFATVFGMIIGDTLPTLIILLGGFMIIMSGMLLSLKNK